MRTHTHAHIQTFYSITAATAANAQGWHGNLPSSLWCHDPPCSAAPPPPSLQVTQLAGVVAKAKAEYDERKARLDQLHERLRECDAEIAAASGELDALRRRLEDIGVEKKRLNHK